jgi:acyl-ACP thioesterase
VRDDADLAGPPSVGRVVTLARHVGLGDTRPDGRLRLDALARFVQDVADHDAATADVGGAGVWVLRRSSFRVLHTPRFRADLTLRTWCSGVGARWAERRTDVEVGGRRAVGAVGLWVYVDRERGVPVGLPDGFHERWGVSAGGRQVRARLVHPPPPASAVRARWPLRAVDLDVLGHVNNAAYWAAAEEELARRGEPVVTRAEIEFRAGLDAGDEVEMLTADTDSGFACWLCVGGEVRASVLVGCDR